MGPLISVVIPIYRVEAFIERCARSLMEQTMDDVEYIFVDDCSPDGSIDILNHVVAEYPQRKVQIIRHEVNHGLPAARNTGLAVTTGEYIFHCDSDDYMECDALEKMYNKAVETDADIVYSDWYLDRPSLTPTVEGRTRYMRCPDYTSSSTGGLQGAEEALRGLLHGTMKYNVWNKLVRRELYNLNPNDNENDNPNDALYNNKGDCNDGANEKVKVSVKVDDVSVVFPDGHGMGEDMTMILLFARAQKVAYLPAATYHYVRQNENAFTAVRTAVSFADLRYNADRVIAALQGRVPDGDIAAFKLNVKYPFLISGHTADYERWQAWYPEANKYISSHQVSARARFLEKCAVRHFYFPLRFHHFLLQYLQR